MPQGNNNSAFLALSKLLQQQGQQRQPLLSLPQNQRPGSLTTPDWMQANRNRQWADRPWMMERGKPAYGGQERTQRNPLIGQNSPQANNRSPIPMPQRMTDFQRASQLMRGVPNAWGV